MDGVSTYFQDLGAGSIALAPCEHSPPRSDNLRKDRAEFLVFGNERITSDSGVQHRYLLGPDWRCHRVYDYGLCMDTAFSMVLPEGHSCFNSWDFESGLCACIVQLCNGSFASSGFSGTVQVGQSRNSSFSWLSRLIVFRGVAPCSRRDEDADGVFQVSASELERTGRFQSSRSSSPFGYLPIILNSRNATHRDSWMGPQRGTADG